MDDTKAAAGPIEASRMKDQIIRARGARAGDISIWDACRNMLRGKQNITFSGTRLVDEPLRPAGTKRNRSITNQLLQPYRTVQSLLRVQQPYFQVTSAVQTYQDITKAAAVEHVARYWWLRNDMAFLAGEAVRAMCVTPCAGFHTFWDPGKQCVKTEVVSAYDLLAEYGAVSWDKAAWVAIRHTYVRGVLAEAYPDHAAWINKQPELTQLDNRAEVPDDRVDVWDIYWRHSGKHVVLCEDKYLWEGEVVAGVEPLQVAEWMTIPGEVWGVCLIDQLLDLQRRYNHATNTILDILDAHAAPKWVAPSNCRVPPESFNNDATQIIYHNPAAKAPIRQPAPPFSQELLAQPGRTQGEMMDTAGIHGSTYGKRSVGISSGKAIEALAERDADQMYATAEALRRAIARSCNNALLLFKAYATEAQMVAYFDQAAGETIAKMLSATDLVEAPEVFIGRETLFEAGVAERDAKLMEMWTTRLVQDPDQILKHLSFNVATKKATEKMVATSFAMDLLEVAKRGGEIQVLPGADMETIKNVFMEYARSPEYYRRATEAAEAFDFTGDARALHVYSREHEIMEYIWSVIVAIETFGQPPEAYMQGVTAKVFPRVDVKPNDAIQTIGATGSQQAQQQMGEAAIDMRTRAGQVQQGSMAFDALKGTTNVPGAVG